MEPYVGEIRIFSSIRIPSGWIPCNGQMLRILPYRDLYSVIGDTFGGDGHDLFKIPDLQGRVVCGAGMGEGLSDRNMGDAVGTNFETLRLEHLAKHSHDFNTLLPAPSALINKPFPGVHLSRTIGQFNYSTQEKADTSLAASMLTPVGTGHTHENRQPTLAMTFCIASHGIMPHSE